MKSYIEDQIDLKNYKPTNATFPVQLRDRTKRRLKRKKIRYLVENDLDEADKLVTTGHRNASDSPTNRKTVIYKGKTIDWITKSKVKFNQLENRECKKITLKIVFGITIDKEIEKKNNWTNKQRSWIEQKINLKGLFTTNLKTISRIDDFRRKFLMSYWGKLSEKCELCGNEWHREHLFLDCPIVKEWEKGVFKNKKCFLNIRLERKKAMFDHLHQYHTFSWIYNWTIWKNYWDINYLKFNDCLNINNQIENLKKMIKFNEYLHLKFSISTLNQNKMETLSSETNLFYFYSLNSSSNRIEILKR